MSETGLVNSGRAVTGAWLSCDACPATCYTEDRDAIVRWAKQHRKPCVRWRLGRRLPEGDRPEDDDG